MQDAVQDGEQEFAGRYEAALTAYLVGAGETALTSAYELGRQALEYDSGMLVVADAHHKALQTHLLHTNHAVSRVDDALILAKAAEFFSECISSFEMAQRGFRESVALLRNMNEMLRGQQRDLNLLLSPMPNLLLTVDEHDYIVAHFIPPDFPPILKVCRVGLPLSDVLPDEISKSIPTALIAMHQGEAVYRIEFSLTLNKEILYFDLQISPVPASRDLLLVIDHITERKLIQIAEHQQRILAEALRDTAITLNSSLEVDKILDRIFISIGQVVPHDIAIVMLIEQDVAYIVRNFDYTGHKQAYAANPISKLQISADTTPQLHQVVESRSPVITSDLASYFEQSGYAGLERSGSGVSVPIFIAKLVIGIISLGSFETDFFTPTHAENLQIFADQAAIAIQNARLYEQAQEIAAHNERQRLARDLHDSVSQSLFAASSIAETATKLWERNPSKVHSLLLDVHQLLRTSMAEMRILLWELRPANLLNTSLDNLITQLVNAFQARTTMTIHCSASETQQLPEDVQITFYRITQESLNNIVKHSEATEARIDLYHQAEQIVLRIHDNGRGFDMADISAGLGLDNIRQRADMIGASLEIASARAQGTEITLAWRETSAVVG